MASIKVPGTTRNHNIPSTHGNNDAFIARNDGNQPCLRPMVIWANPPAYRICAWCGWKEAN